MRIDKELQSKEEFKEFKELEPNFSKVELNQKNLSFMNRKSRYLALQNVFLIRNKNLSSENLTMYILCLRNIQDVLSPGIFENEFDYLIKKFEKILFSLDLVFKEKSLIISRIEDFYEVFSENFENKLGKKKVIRTFKEIAGILNIFIEITEDSFTNGEDEIGLWMLRVDMQFKKVLKTFTSYHTLKI